MTLHRTEYTRPQMGTRETAVKLNRSAGCIDVHFLVVICTRALPSVTTGETGRGVHGLPLHYFFHLQRLRSDLRIQRSVINKSTAGISYPVLLLLLKLQNGQTSLPVTTH